MIIVKNMWVKDMIIDAIIWGGDRVQENVENINLRERWKDKRDI